MKKKWIQVPGFVLVAAALLGLCLPSSSFADEPKFKDEYKLTFNVAPSFYWGMGAAKFADLVKEKTNGRINVKPYYNSALLKGAQLQSPQMVATRDNRLRHRVHHQCVYGDSLNEHFLVPFFHQ